jgi:uncharacterized protein
MKTIIAGKVYVAEASGKGRGVFAVCAIKKGEIIEQCPCLTFGEGKEAEHIDQTPLECYYFRWKDSVNAILFGFGSLYNHSYSPNAVYVQNYPDTTMDFVAHRDIAPREEITINYNGIPESKEPLWFCCAENESA